MCNFHVQNLERYIQNVPTELILNLDEVGSQKWSNQKKRKIIIPYQASPRRIEYSVPRKEKCTSCITTISRACDVLMPFLVIHQKTGDDAVWEDGWRNEQNFLIRFNDRSYMTRPIFKEYVREVVRKYFSATRETVHLYDFAGVLLCDNCSSHNGEEVMALLARENIRLITVPPHTSYLSQPLGLVNLRLSRGRNERSCQSAGRFLNLANSYTYEDIGSCHGFVQQPHCLPTSWADDQSPGVSAGGRNGVSPVSRND
jgi:hypothetical protein